jgi:hypothetical protein
VAGCCEHGNEHSVSMKGRMTVSFSRTLFHGVNYVRGPFEKFID